MSSSRSFASIPASPPTLKPRTIPPSRRRAEPSSRLLQPTFIAPSYRQTQSSGLHESGPASLGPRGPPAPRKARSGPMSRPTPGPLDQRQALRPSLRSLVPARTAPSSAAVRPCTLPGRKARIALISSLSSCRHAVDIPDRLIESGIGGKAQALAVKVEAVPEGYFRIGPYLDSAEGSERPCFCSRSTKFRAILRPTHG
jgi:hypothetical protein